MKAFCCCFLKVDALLFLTRINYQYTISFFSRFFFLKETKNHVDLSLWVLAYRVLM